MKTIQYVWVLCISICLFSCSSDTKDEGITNDSSNNSEDSPSIENTLSDLANLVDKGKMKEMEEAMKGFEEIGKQFEDNDKMKEFQEMMNQIGDKNKENSSPEEIKEIINQFREMGFDVDEDGNLKGDPKDQLTKLLNIDMDGIEGQMDKIEKIGSDFDEQNRKKVAEFKREKAIKGMTPEEVKIYDEHIPHLSEYPIHSVEDIEEFRKELEAFGFDEKYDNEDKSKAMHKALYKVKSRNRTAKGFERKAKSAEKAFKKLNPDLDFGENVGETYFSENNEAIYLPLGELSFADELVDYVKKSDQIFPMDRCLGSPDYIKGKGNLKLSKGVSSLGKKGQITIKFNDNALVNVNGPDLYVFEIGKIEPTRLEISKDGKEWINVGEISGGIAMVDIESFVEEDELYYYVRLTDLATRSELPGADVDAVAAIGAAMRLQLNSAVLFDTGESTLKEEGLEAIAELVGQLKNIEKARIIVEGHTDDVGDNQSNKKLSQNRAASVSNEMKKLLSSKKELRFQEKGYGESRPIEPNDSDENRQKNRRVEILILPL